MRKIIFLLIAVVFTFPAAADWKVEVIDEFMAASHVLVDALDKGAPEQGTASKHALYNGLVGVCVGFAGSTQRAVPSSIADDSAKVLKTFLRGERPADADIRQLGLDCLTYIEDYMVSQGATKEAIGALILPVLKAQIQNLTSHFPNEQ